jgi:hypothetical protein
MREGAMKTRDAATALIVGDCACRQLCRLPPTIKESFLNLGDET